VRCDELAIMSQDSQVFHLISVYIKSVQWNPSKQNLVGTNFCVRNRQVFGLYRLNYIGTLFKVGFIQDFNLFRVQFRQVSLYLVIFVLVYKVKINTPFFLGQSFCILIYIYLLCNQLLSPQQFWVGILSVVSCTPPYTTWCHNVLSVNYDKAVVYSWQGCCLLLTRLLFTPDKAVVYSWQGCCLLQILFVSSINKTLAVMI
jgi:hypothetical protein